MANNRLRSIHRHRDTYRSRKDMACTYLVLATGHFEGTSTNSDDHFERHCLLSTWLPSSSAPDDVQPSCDRRISSPLAISSYWQNLNQLNIDLSAIAKFPLHRLPGRSSFDPVQVELLKIELLLHVVASIYTADSDTRRLSMKLDKEDKASQPLPISDLIKRFDKRTRTSKTTRSTTSRRTKTTRTTRKMNRARIQTISGTSH